MLSHEAIRKAVNGKTVEHAKRLHKSTSLLNKWQEPCIDYTDSGSHNPLDRIETIVSTSLDLGTARDEALAPVYYLARRFGLILLKLPDPAEAVNAVSKDLLKSVHEFGDLAAVASRALDDGTITGPELAVINQEGWEAIQAIATFMKRAKESIR